MSDEPLRFRGMIMAWKEEILHCYFGMVILVCLLLVSKDDLVLHLFNFCVIFSTFQLQTPCDIEL